VTKLHTRCSHHDLMKLRAGTPVLLSGPVVACRDRAHRRMADLLARGMPLPFDPMGAAVFYAAPTPAPPGRASGAVGPTTSARMDPWTPLLLQAGVRILVGKGPRSSGVSAAINSAGAVYLAAPGGTAALGGGCVVSCGVLAWDDLGSEALYSMELREYPVFVALDTMGQSIFTRGGKP